MAIVLATAILLTSIGGWYLAHSGSAAPLPLPLAEAANPPAADNVLVFVSGAVASPGLYQLSPDARVADAIAAAGGVTSEADRGHLPNMAARVHDGRQINVPFRKTSSAAAAKLDLNSATLDELDAVPGMPPGLAAAIVQYRSDWGPFSTLTQLRTDLGVDAATVTGLRQYLRIAPPGG